MWIWDPCYGTIVLWIVWFDFHLGLWEEVVEDRILIFYSTLHQQAFGGMVLWDSVEDHLSPYIPLTSSPLCQPP